MTSRPFVPTARPSRDLGFTHLLAYDHVVGADPAVHRRLGRPVRRDDDVPRAVRDVRVPRGGHVDRARDRDHHPPAAADRARREAGRGGGPADRRTVPARRRAGLESRRVRGARPALRSARAAHERADRTAARAVDRAVGDVRRHLRPRHRRRARAHARAAADPGVDRRLLGPGLPPHRRARRRLVPAGPPGRGPRPRPRHHPARPPNRRDAIPTTIGMEGRRELATRTTPIGSRVRSSAGGRWARRISRSTRCTPVKRPSRTTCARSGSRRVCAA